VKFMTVYGLPVFIIDPSLAPGSPTGPTGTPIDRDMNPSSPKALFHFRAKRNYPAL